MAAYLTDFILWDSLVKDILLVLLAFVAAQITWLSTARVIPSLRTKNKDGEPLYMPFPRLLILCAVFSAVWIALATPSAEEDSTTKTTEIRIKKTTITPPKSDGGN